MADMSPPLIRNPAAFVPPSALAFGASGSTAEFVSADMPLPVRDGAYSMDLAERLNREGEPFSSHSESSYSSFAAPSGSGTATSSGFSSGPAVGRAIYLSHLLLSCTTPVMGRYQIGGSNWATGVGSPTLLDIGFSCGPAYMASIPVGIFIQSSQKPHFGAYISRWLDAAVSGTHWFRAGAVGWSLADAINFDARKAILFLGDSLWNGTGPSDITRFIPWQVNAFYRQRGQDCRFVLKTYSGSTTSGHETFRKTGRYDFPQIDAIFYQLGSNDAAQGYATATSMANIAALTEWKRRLYPRAKLVLVGSPPAENAAVEGALAALRAAQAAYVDALADPNVLFCDLGGAFNRLSPGNYVSSDTAGSRIHPDDSGLDQIWQGGFNGFAGLEAWLAANLPEI